MKRKALGKGIQSLIPPGAPSDKLAEVDISRIKPSPYQPRRRFDPEKLEELAASIRNSGIIQPVVVAREEDGTFTLIAGERRWRAAQLAKMTRIPAVFRDLPEEKKAEYALIENIQRQDLNPVEEALAYKSLLERYKLTQEELSERLGKKRSSITNMLRILKLPEEVLASVEDGRVSLGHAKILSGIPDVDRQLELARMVQEKGLTVRALEARLKKTGKATAVNKEADIFLKDGEERLAKKLGTAVKIKGNASRGSIVIRYHSKEQLISLFESLMQR
ncbi:MAG: ParB/RepB/Spo0J family partition protein [Acidobacteria bacterium]|nr:ParB/RepB/Spo0J family partition protein [Acidobacteriota bacterium]